MDGEAVVHRNPGMLRPDLAAAAQTMAGEAGAADYMQPGRADPGFEPCQARHCFSFVDFGPRPPATTGMLRRTPQNLSVPDTVGYREPIRLQWVTVCINEIETVPPSA